MSTADEIKKLKDLLDAGAITQDEYEIEKAKLLDGGNGLTSPTPLPIGTPVGTVMPVKKKRNGCLTVVVVFFIIGGIIAVIGSLTKTTTPTSAESGREAITATELPDEPLTQAEILASAVDMTDEQSKMILAALNECGVVLQTIVHEDNLDGLDGDTSIGYRLLAEKDTNVTMYLGENNSIISIRHADRDMYRNGEFVETLQMAMNPPNLELVGDVSVSNDEFAIYFEGTIKNNNNKEYSYVQITFGIYDEQDNKIGTALANINNLGSLETWKFKAMGLSVPEGAFSYRVDEITGF